LFDTETHRPSGRINESFSFLRVTIMSAMHGFRPSRPLVLLGIGFLAMALLGQLTASQTTPAAAPAVRWEYTTTMTDPAQLQSRLTELGQDGWEVFSIERADSQLVQPNASDNHITTTQYQITGKRPKR